MSHKDPARKISPPAIKKLEEAVINRIAAGEVVQRPSAAVKELIENSIDAGATAITVSAKAGGLQFLQIQDNGHGIRKVDLPIVCERFTTSKLNHFDDLKSIATFGFRGEALASITHVAHVTIQTKTVDSPCAYKAKYADGKMVPLRAGERSEPRPCAGLIGTTITVEDMFYNMKTRKQAFRNVNEEYQRIVEVMVRYSIRFGDAGISFICKKHGQALPDLHTATNDSTLDNIKASFGSALAKELLELNFTYNCNDEDSEQCEDLETIHVEGKVSNGNYSTKKAVFIFFINNRLVECSSLKKAIDTIYGEILPRHMHPFIYLNIHMPPHHLDVNVHPTKKEVHFLHEDILLEKLHEQLWQLLRTANESRSFQIQTTLLPFQSAPQVASDSQTVDDGSENEEMSHSLKFQIDTDRVTINNETSQYSKAMVSTLRKPSDFILASKNETSKSSSSSLNMKGKSTAPNKLVRTDARQVPINAIFKVQSTETNKVDRHAWPSSEPSADIVDEDATSKCECTTPLLVPTKQSSQNNSIEESQHGSEDNGSSNQDTDENHDSTEALEEQRNVVRTDEHTLEVSEVEQPRKKRKLLLKTPGAFAMGCLCCGKLNANPSVSYAMPCNPTTSSNNEIQRKKFGELKITSCEYSSIQKMIKGFKVQSSQSISKMMKNYTFVGAVNSMFSLIQHGTKLLMVNHFRLLREFFYQLVIKQFGELNYMEIVSPINIRDFLHAAVLIEDQNQRLPPILNDGESFDDKEQWIEKVVMKAFNKLIGNAEMLEEYFRIYIDTENGSLCGMPQLLVDYTPLSEELPLFLLRLAIEVQWDDEYECFHSIAWELAKYYSVLETQSSTQQHKQNKVLPLLTEKSANMLQSHLFPAMRMYLTPPRRMEHDHTITQVAALEQLYKVFERC